MDEREEFSQEIVDAIRYFLVDDDWNFEFDDEKGIFRFGVNLDSKLKNVRYFVPVRGDGYTVYAISPINADNEDKDVMREMNEFINRANYGLRNGNFELDVRDGEIRYKIYVDCDNQLPSKEIIRSSIVIPSVMFERYSPGLLDVMFRGSSAEEAIAKCE